MSGTDAVGINDVVGAPQMAVARLGDSIVAPSAVIQEAAVPEVVEPGIVPMDPSPWEQPVDGGQMLRDICGLLREYVSMAEECIVAIALWIVFSHVYEAFRVVAILAVISPLPRCGKTTLLTILSCLVPRPLAASNITPAAIFRTVDECTPSLLIDEADSFLSKREDMRGILNSGHTRETAYVIRMDRHGPRKFSTFCPKVIAQIGRLTSTLEDRSILIALRRVRRSEGRRGVRKDLRYQSQILHRRIARWAIDYSARLESLDPDIPQDLHDRAADNWQPLLAIADLIGGEWPELARAAARKLTAGMMDHGAATGEMLLNDIAGVIKTMPRQKMIPSARLVSALNQMEDRPWPAMMHGQPLTKCKLASMLSPFEIRPGLYRPDKHDNQKKVTRGYNRADLQQAYEEYCGP